MLSRFLMLSKGRPISGTGLSHSLLHLYLNGDKSCRLRPMGTSSMMICKSNSMANGSAQHKTIILQCSLTYWIFFYKTNKGDHHSLTIPRIWIFQEVSLNCVAFFSRWSVDLTLYEKWVCIIQIHFIFFNLLNVLVIIY